MYFAFILNGFGPKINFLIWTKYMTTLPQFLQKMAVLLLKRHRKIKLKLCRRQFVQFCKVKWQPSNSKFHKRLI